MFWNNEVKANAFVSWCLLLLGGVLILTGVLVRAGIFTIPHDDIANVLIIHLPLIVASCFIAQQCKMQKHWIKYMLCIVSVLIVIGLCSIIRIFVGLIICIPVLLSTRYYSRRFTIFVAVLSVAALAVSIFMFGRSPFVDLNFVDAKPGWVLTVTDTGLRGAVLANGYDKAKYMQNLFHGSFMPDLLLYSVIAYVCTELSRRAHEMVLEQTEISEKTESIKAELNMATAIQTAVMPKIFPPFPERKDLDIYASMNPAKEVGGDFYDFYLLDEDHLVLVIADVSGKGVPAALFMMITKALVKTFAGIYKSPAKIAEEVNRRLCSENAVDMFVTAWIGILDIPKGEVTAVDCGHEYPFLQHEGGGYEVVKAKKSFVLGGMDASRFHEYTFEMHPGDSLFLYTDGVPEAINSQNEQYGMERLNLALNKNKESTETEILKAVKKDVDDFVQDATQFDDMTMVGLRLKK